MTPVVTSCPLLEIFHCPAGVYFGIVGLLVSFQRYQGAHETTSTTAAFLLFETSPSFFGAWLKHLTAVSMGTGFTSPVGDTKYVNHVQILNTVRMHTYTYIPIGHDLCNTYHTISLSKGFENEYLDVSCSYLCVIPMIVLFLVLCENSIVQNIFITV